MYKVIKKKKKNNFFALTIMYILLLTVKATLNIAELYNITFPFLAKSFKNF